MTSRPYSPRSPWGAHRPSGAVRGALASHPAARLRPPRLENLNAGRKSIVALKSVAFPLFYLCSHVRPSHLPSQLIDFTPIHGNHRFSPLNCARPAHISHVAFRISHLLFNFWLLRVKSLAQPLAISIFLGFPRVHFCLPCLPPSAARCRPARACVSACPGTGTVAKSRQFPALPGRPRMAAICYGE